MPRAQAGREGLLPLGITTALRSPWLPVASIHLSRLFSARVLQLACRHLCGPHPERGFTASIWWGVCTGRGEGDAPPSPNAGRRLPPPFGLVPPNMSQQKWLQVGGKRALRAASAALVPLQHLPNTSPVLRPRKKDQTTA